MRNHLTACLLVAAALVASRADAQSLDACSDIALASDSTCEVQVSGGCTAQCEPVHFRAACAADLWASCDGGCTGSVTAECMASCDVSACQARCEVDPGTFDCHADCELNASASCSAQCSASAGADAQAECQASCESTFSAQCNASCEATPPSASCMAECQASCEGSCRAESTLSCQVDCQAGGYADCYATVEGGCMTQCAEPSGALFCDGQYVDVRSSVQACIDQIESALDVTVDVSATGSASCDDAGVCTAEGTVSVGGCSVNPGAAHGGYGVLGLLGLMLLGARRRR